jgi:hypothetical protein
LLLVDADEDGLECHQKGGILPLAALLDLLLLPLNVSLSPAHFVGAGVLSAPGGNGALARLTGRLVIIGILICLVGVGQSFQFVGLLFSHNFQPFQMLPDGIFPAIQLLDDFGTSGGQNDATFVPESCIA